MDLDRCNSCLQPWGTHDDMACPRFRKAWGILVDPDTNDERADENKDPESEDEEDE